ncbi:sigma-54-dependent transcriptional regulator [Ferrimonas aestuarii]|uniref:Sigma-54-dependent Fis family transcriptional regulator n=1 Tax=Ferrimonas aestuarii TaxID=2569539 RepID=A0A4U1BM01_9GAMM|nr:sigma-54 dependent transcriptional regulator [Ferrimonas aestuarii]TKB51698.1 sigma-54-dependent Fis family transcriptional regulator [Ferrimonas aestuarii]
MEQILIVDDNPAIVDALTLLLELADYQCLSALSPEQALNQLEHNEVALVIQDMNFSSDTTSGEEGKALFYQLRQRQPDLPVILLTAWTEVSMAVELVKAGAADYLGKPWDDDKLLTSVANLMALSQSRQALKHQRYRQQALRDQLEQHQLCGTIFASTQMEQLIHTAIQVAKSDLPVMITGPNGAGKEKIAEIIHANSSLNHHPFIKVNVGALPADLMEAELFGAEVGAYTGATKTRIGRFEAADGGTLFLDELGTLPLSGQVKLLRVLQSGEFERLGSSQTRKVCVRVLSATNADLTQAMADGEFREDLYYRLNVIPLELPPLAERSDDILPLARHFLTTTGALLTAQAEQALLSHSWPGNVRELENTMARATLLSGGDNIEPKHLALPQAKAPCSNPPHPPCTEKTTSTQLPNREPSKLEIIQALSNQQGIIARAAKSLGLSRQALYRRMEKLGIER